MTGHVVTGKFVGQPRVDIILPTRNRAARTWEAVQSVLAQSYEKWRLIIVDDASDQTELRKLEHLLPSHSRIKLVRRSRPGGAQAARETGVSYSRSQLIAFLDSDDLWLADKLQRQVSLLLTNASVSSKTVVLCGYQWLTAAGTTRLIAVPSRANYLTDDNMSSLLVTARALESAGGVRRTDVPPLTTGEGIDLCIRLFQTAGVLIAPECLALRRDQQVPHNNGQSRSVSATAYEELIRRHCEFLSTGAPSLYYTLSVRAGGRFLDARQYSAAVRHLAVAIRIGSARQRVGVLKVIAAVVAKHLKLLPDAAPQRAVTHSS